MKINRLTLLIVALSTLSACDNKTNIESLLEPPPIINYEYDDIKDITIYWNNILIQERDSYFVYVFSKTCSHCQEFKNEIIKYAIEDHNPIYFVEYNHSIPIIENRENVIQKNELDDIGVVGVPSMFEIVDKTIINYYVGAKEIKDVF